MRVGIRGRQNGGAGRPRRGSKPPDKRPRGGAHAGSIAECEEQINEHIGAPVASMDQLQDAQEQVNEQISAPVASSDTSPLETSATDTIPTVPALSAEPVVAGIATIANAYGAYTGEIGRTDLVPPGKARGRAVAR